MKSLICAVRDTRNVKRCIPRYPRYPLRRSFPPVPRAVREMQTVHTSVSEVSSYVSPSHHGFAVHIICRTAVYRQRRMPLYLITAHAVYKSRIPRHPRYETRKKPRFLRCKHGELLCSLWCLMGLRKSDAPCACP